MPQDGRPPGSDVVDEAAAIDILDAASLGPPDKKRLPVHVTEGPDRGIDPTGNHSPGGLEELARYRSIHRVGRDYTTEGGIAD